MKNNIKLVIGTIISILFLTFAAISFAQMPEVKKSDDAALYQQTLDKLAKTDAAFAAKKATLDQIAEREKKATQPNKKAVCAALADANALLHNRIADYNYLVELQTHHKFQEHQSKIDMLVYKNGEDIRGNQEIFTKTAADNSCQLSDKTSGGAENKYLVSNPFDFSFDTTPAGGNLSAQNESTAKFAELMDNLKDFDNGVPISDIIKAAADLTVQGYADAALKSLNEFIKKHPDNADAYAQKAFAEYEIQSSSAGDQQFDEAAGDAQQTIKIDQQNAFAYYITSEIENDELNFDESIKDEKKALELADRAVKANPRSAGAYYQRGVINQFKKTDIADFTKAVELDPQFAAAYFQRGASLDANNDHYAALADLNKTIALSPKFFTAYMLRGAVYYHLGEIDKAVADIRRAVELNPNNIEAPQRLKFYAAPPPATELTERFNFFQAEFNKEGEKYNRAVAKYQETVKNPAEKTAVCASLNALDAEFQVLKKSAAKMYFVNQYTDLAEFKEAPTYVKTIADYIETTQKNIKSEAAAHQCVLPVH